MSYRSFYSILLVVVLLGAWQVVCAIGLVSPLMLASPYNILSWFADNYSSYSLWQDINATLARVIKAFVVSIIIGVPIGFVMGYYRIIEESLTFIVDFSRSIPATAMFPVFILFFGSGEESRVAAAVYGASLIIIINTILGVKQSKKTRLKTAIAYGASGVHLFWFVLLPEALPSIIAGFRLAVSLVFVIIVLVEMFIGTSFGIGHRIIDSQMLYEIPQMYACVVLAGTIGYFLNFIFYKIEKKILHYVGH
ncbi:MAG: ABC transporter permease [Magnetococcales bacterium]|nr:ABC transporter permease [Magnetococcales bacterium]